MEIDHIRIESNPDVTVYHILIRIRIQIDLVEYEYKTNVSDTDFYSVIYTIQLKMLYC
jgi:hypothetical protein